MARKSYFGQTAVSLLMLSAFKSKQKVFEVSFIIHSLSIPSHHPHHCVSLLAMCLTAMSKERSEMGGRPAQLMYRLWINEHTLYIVNSYMEQVKKGI